MNTNLVKQCKIATAPEFYRTKIDQPRTIPKKEEKKKEKRKKKSIDSIILSRKKFIMPQHNVYTETFVSKRILCFVFLSANSHMVKGSEHRQFVSQYRVIYRSVEM